MGPETPDSGLKALPDGDKRDWGEESDNLNTDEDRPKLHSPMPEEVGKDRPHQGTERFEGTVDTEALPRPIPGSSDAYFGLWIRLNQR